MSPCIFSENNRLLFCGGCFIMFLMQPNTALVVTVHEAGRRGGLRTLERHGVNHFKFIAKKPRRRRKDV